MRSWIAAGAMLAAAASAHAQPSFMAEEGHWTVNDGGGRCYATNRPPQEVTITPYNGLLLSMGRDGRLVVQVMFWPGAFRPEASVRLTLVGAPGIPPFETAARAVSDSAVETVEALRDDFLRGLRGGLPMLRIAAAGAGRDLSFDMRRFDAVMTQLEACVRRLPPG